MEWFYEQNGQQVGPVSRAEIIRLIVQRRIHPHTLVWNPDFGDQWRPAIKAGLVVPLPGRFQGAATEQGEQGPKHVAAVPSFWAWIYILVPNALSILVQCIAYARGVEGTPLVAVLFLLAISFVSLIMDRRLLQSASIKPPSLWWYFFFPGYFIMRRERLGRGRALIACAVAVFIVRAVVYLTVSLPTLEKMAHVEMEPHQGGVHAPHKPSSPAPEDGSHPSSPQQHDDDEQEPSSENQTTI